MPSPTEITVSRLDRRIGLPDAPIIIDVRGDHDHVALERSLMAYAALLAWQRRAKSETHNRPSKTV